LNSFPAHLFCKDAVSDAPSIKIIPPDTVLYETLTPAREAAVNRHKFVNSGFIAGPLCPIYGTGAVAVAVFLPELKENLIFLFIGGMIVTSFVEYITGRLMEKILHKKWWDYSDQKFHLDGYICLRVSALWGVVQCTDHLPESVFLRSCQYDTPFDRRSDLMGAFRPAYCGWSRFGNCGS